MQTADWTLPENFKPRSNGRGQHNGNGHRPDPLESLFRDPLVWRDAEVDKAVLDGLQDADGAASLKVLRIRLLETVHFAPLLRSLSRLEMLGHVRRDGTRYSVLR